MGIRKESLRNCHPTTVFRVAELFFEDPNPRMKTIAQRVNDELNPSPRVTREMVYPILAQAKKLGYVRLEPPLQNDLAARVADSFGLDLDDISVVATPGRQSNQYVAAAAARRVFDQIVQRTNPKRPVTLGLGPGRATLDFSRELGLLIRSANQPVRIRLVAISAGCPPHQPQYASSTFFNLFPSEAVEDFVGFFAETLVKKKNFEKLQKEPGIKEVFREHEVIDLVVTSMGDFEDEHDLLRDFLCQGNMTIEDIRRKGWIGNVQYRAYSSRDYVVEGPNDYRATTLFELTDFYTMAREKKRDVVLIARQCGACGMTRARALRPLLTVPRLKVWSKLVMDVATARDLLSDGHRAQHAPDHTV